MQSVAALLADLHAQVMREGEEKLARFLSTPDRRDGLSLVNSARTEREETTAMTTPFGYTYRAEILCPFCTVEALMGCGQASLAAHDMRVEDVLDQVAGANGIDRDDETTFDSDEFPKVVLDQDVPEGEVCGNCGGEL